MSDKKPGTSISNSSDLAGSKKLGATPGFTFSATRQAKQDAESQKQEAREPSI